MEKGGGSKDEERIVIKPSFNISELADNNEIQFSISHDKRKVLTVNVQLDSVGAVIRRILFECITGKIEIEEYDADPDKGGSVLENKSINIQEGLQDSQIQQLFDLWLLDSFLYVLKNLMPGVAKLLADLEYEAALDWVKNAQSRINEGGYSIDNKIIKIMAAEMQGELVPEKILIEEYSRRDIELLRQRLGTRGRGGSEGWWNEERRAEFLELYEDVHKRVKAKSSDLPPDIQARLSLRGEKPSEIACEYAARLYGVPANDYLPRVLTKARQEQKRRTMKAPD